MGQTVVIKALFELSHTFCNCWRFVIVRQSLCEDPLPNIQCLMWYVVPCLKQLASFPCIIIRNAWTVAAVISTSVILKFQGKDVRRHTRLRNYFLRWNLWTYKCGKGNLAGAARMLKDTEVFQKWTQWKQIYHLDPRRKKLFDFDFSLPFLMDFRNFYTFPMSKWPAPFKGYPGFWIFGSFFFRGSRAKIPSGSRKNRETAGRQRRGNKTKYRQSISRSAATWDTPTNFYTFFEKNAAKNQVLQWNRAKPYRHDKQPPPWKQQTCRDWAVLFRNRGGAQICHNRFGAAVVSSFKEQCVHWGCVNLISGFQNNGNCRLTVYKRQTTKQDMPEIWNRFVNLISESQPDDGRVAIRNKKIQKHALARV